MLDDLVKALKNKEISGAGLDVFEREPLPKNHELWKFENAIIWKDKSVTYLTKKGKIKTLKPKENIIIKKK